MIFKVFGTLYGDVERPVAICISGASDEDDAKRMAMAFEPEILLGAVQRVRWDATDGTDGVTVPLLDTEHEEMSGATPVTQRDGLDLAMSSSP